MTVELAKPVMAYFQGTSHLNVDAILAPFADDAEVQDEGRVHRGRDSIREWIEEATIGNKAIANPKSVTSEADQQIVRAEVSGAFPGAPITLTFRFTIAGDRITRLKIS